MRRRAWASMPLAAVLALSAPAVQPAHAGQGETAQEGSTRTLYLVLIRQARLDGKPRAALAYLDDFDRQHPGDREAKVLRVNCLLDLGQIDGAETALAQIPGADRNADALAVRGHVLAARQRWAEATGAYASAQALSPADPSIGNALGYAQLRAGQLPQAVETLKRTLDLAPAAAPEAMVARNNLALALTAAGRSAEAAALLARVRDAGERQRLQMRLAAEAVRIAAPGSGS